jgi:hypothetical protein
MYDLNGVRRTRSRVKRMLDSLNIHFHDAVAVVPIAINQGDKAHVIFSANHPLAAPPVIPFRDRSK